MRCCVVAVSPRFSVIFHLALPQNVLRPITFSKAKPCKCYIIVTWENLWRTLRSNTWFIFSSPFFGKKSKILLFLVGKEKHGIIFHCPFPSSSCLSGMSVTALYYCFLEEGCSWATGYPSFSASEHMDRIQLLLCVNDTTRQSNPGPLRLLPGYFIPSNLVFDHRAQTCFFTIKPPSVLSVDAFIVLGHPAQSVCDVGINVIIIKSWDIWRWCSTVGPEQPEPVQPVPPYWVQPADTHLPHLTYR